MKLFTRNSPYYHILKYLLFLLKHPVYIYICISYGGLGITFQTTELKNNYHYNLKLKDNLHRTWERKIIAF